MLQWLQQKGEFVSPLSTHLSTSARQGQALLADLTHNTPWENSR